MDCSFLVCCVTALQHPCPALLILSMPMFDLEKTASLERLFLVASEERDAQWIAALYDAAADASLATREQQIIQGPDGFRYFALYLPTVGQEFDAFCVRHIVNA